MAWRVGKSSLPSSRSTKPNRRRVPTPHTAKKAAAQIMRDATVAVADDGGGGGGGGVSGARGDGGKGGETAVALDALEHALGFAPRSLAPLVATAAAAEEEREEFDCANRAADHAVAVADHAADTPLGKRSPRSDDDDDAAAGRRAAAATAMVALPAFARLLRRTFTPSAGAGALSDLARTLSHCGAWGDEARSHRVAVPALFISLSRFKCAFTRFRVARDDRATVSSSSSLG